MMKHFLRKKAQEERIGTPIAIFKVKRVGMTKTFKRLNKSRNYTLERTLEFPIYYDFSEKDIPAIHEEIVAKSERSLREGKDIGFTISSVDGLFAKFRFWGEVELKNGIDYEYHITHERVTQKVKKMDFSHIKDLTSISK